SSFSKGRPSPLPHPPVQYADFAVWQRQRLQGETLERQMAYWKQQLAHLPPPLDLPADRPRPPVQTFNGASLPLTLAATSTAGVRSLSRQEDVTLFMLLLAAFQTALHHQTRRTDILVGTPMAGRTRSETENLIGFFANTLVLRADFSDDPTFREVLRRVRDTALGAYQCQDLPFDRLVEELRLERDPSRNPLFQVGFAWQNAPLASLNLPGLEPEHVDLESGITRVDLELHVWDDGGQIQGRLVYNRDLFDESNVRQLADDFVRLVDQIISSPERRVSEFQPRPHSPPRQSPAFSPLQLAEIEAALREEPALAQVIVRERQDKAGQRRLIAYVVPAGRFSAETLRARAQCRLPAAKLPHAFLPLTSLPLAPDGTLDENALAGFGVIDAKVAKRWEDSLRAVPGIERAAVVVKECHEPIWPVHLSDVLVDWQPASAISTPTATPILSRPPHATSDKPAIAHGRPLAAQAEGPMHVGETLHRAARLLDRGIFYHEPDGSEIEQPYSALLLDAQKVVCGLRCLGLKPQDKVILQLEQSKDFLTAFWGCVLGGIVPVPLSIAPSYKTVNSAVKKLQHACELLENPLIIAGQRFSPEIQSWSALPGLENLEVARLDHLLAHEADSQMHPSQADDLALLLLTSGSTGHPKGVMLSHRNLLAMAAGTAQANHFTPEDVALNWMPLDHVGAISFLHLMAVYLGCQQVQVPKELILQQPLRWLDWIERHRATISWGPNFAISLINERAEQIRQRRWDLSSMRFLVNAGEAVVPRTARRFIQLLTPHGLPAAAMRPAFGMSETCSGITWSEGFTLEGTSDKDSFAELGPVIPGASMRIVDDENRVVMEGVMGRLQFQGASVTAGYYQNSQLNAETFTPDGWFDTGDRGFLRNARLTITGREKDVIIINGSNIHSHEIEAVVEEIPGIEVSYTAACAVRAPGSDTDQLAIFFSAACRDDAGLRDLLHEIRQRITREFGVNPACLLPVARDMIPKTEIGKIQRAQLRQRLERGEFDTILKRVDVLSANANTIPNWFFRKIWVRKQGRARATAGAFVCSAQMPPPSHEPLESEGRVPRGPDQKCMGLAELVPPKFPLTPSLSPSGGEGARR
ncbi:MAG TPA: condensation domain-containing protein, partial [Verrucomicrobiae bacterium]